MSLVRWFGFLVAHSSFDTILHTPLHIITIVGFNIGFCTFFTTRPHSFMGHQKPFVLSRMRRTATAQRCKKLQAYREKCKNTLLFAANILSCYGTRIKMRMPLGFKQVSLVAKEAIETRGNGFCSTGGVEWAFNPVNSGEARQ